jgi:hypothetical protein
MYLLEGAVSFADAHGKVTFRAGDACLFVRGDGCAWISEEYVKKIYATQRPVADLSEKGRRVIVPRRLCFGINLPAYCAEFECCPCRDCW